MLTSEHLPRNILLAVLIPFVVVLAAYWFNFSDGWFHKLSKDPADWSYFGGYVGGLLAPIYAAIAAVGAFMSFIEIRGQNKFDRDVTMLRQSLNARPHDFGDQEPTEIDARNNLVLAISDNVVDGDGWHGVLETFVARQYDFLDLPVDKIVRRLEEAVAIIDQQETNKRKQHLLNWLYIELRDHEYYLMAAHVMSVPDSRLTIACREMGLFKEYHFESREIAKRLIDIGFQPASD